MKHGTILLSAQLTSSLLCQVGRKIYYYLFSTLAASRLGLKMSLFLTQAAMNFVLERRNGRKRSIFRFLCVFPHKI